MYRQLILSAICVVALSDWAVGQMLSFPTSSAVGNSVGLDAIQSAQMDFNIFTVNSQNPSTTPLQGPNGAVSKLDMKAPGKAQREYGTGYQMLLRGDIEGAVQHLGQSLTFYPKFVAAHNALGTAYLNLNQNEQARNEFAKAVELDDHLPNSYLNLGCAQLALKDFPGAEESFRKASAIAPLDLQLLTAKAYGEYANKDFPAVLDTVKAVHARKHEGAEVVHFFAAGAFEAQGNLEGSAARTGDVVGGKSENSLCRAISYNASGDQGRRSESG